MGIRVNGSYREGETALDRNENEVVVGALGADYRGERLRASIDLNHSDQKVQAPTSLFNAAAPGIAIPRAPKGSVNTANGFEFIDSTYDMAAGRVEFDLFDDTTIYAAAGTSRYREDFLTSSYTIGDSRIRNARPGDAQVDFGFNPQEIEGLTGEIGLRSAFDTGPVGHQSTSRRPARATRTIAASSTRATCASRPTPPTSTTPSPSRARRPVSPACRAPRTRSPSPTSWRPASRCRTPCPSSRTGSS